ncbi:hypothetical protein C8R43DRAFT_1128853 [Mycena crocata]|nr:hypothetical protein C8R43DRAFT_1128853 [Mycena crocata]
MSPIPDILRTAVDLKEALDNAAEYLVPIGTCRSKASEWRKEYDDDEYMEEDDELEDEGKLASEKVEIKVMEELFDLQSNHMNTVAFGEERDLPLFIKITRAGCEYDGDIRAFTSKKGSAAPDTDSERLKLWYEAGAVSGYGDVKAQETKVDPAVRDAREIPANEFTVSADLIARVQDIWGASFFPTLVRAEPYKIHLYGPGGKFKAHRDTPENDLVGTFLVGLGDTSKTKERSWDGAFEIKMNENWRTCHTAHLGSWIAFYPDVDHSVREISSGHRAVIAFKIFRQHLDTPEVPADVVLRNKIREALMPLHKPYGILLQHHYSAGTSELSGVDAALSAAAGITGGDVKLLPVLIRWNATRDHAELEYRDVPQCSADVFPITGIHVDAVLAHIRAKRVQTVDEDEDNASRSSKSKLSVDLKGTDSEWINFLHSTSVPFYSPSFSDTSIAWKEDVQEAIEHTGNESRPHQEDSIYLSYALVVLPGNRGTKRAVEEEDD